jgi:hypothetical protein
MPPGRGRIRPTCSPPGIAVGYNGLAKKHYVNIPRAKEMEHEVIVYCKANPQLKIIQAIDVMIKRYREERGITVAK